MFSKVFFRVKYQESSIGFANIAHVQSIADKCNWIMIIENRASYTGKNQCIPHFVKIVELLWKPVISTVFPNCGIVFFHSKSRHSILYSDQSVEILWKFLPCLQSVEKCGISLEILWCQYCGICKLFCKCKKTLEVVWD